MEFALLALVAALAVGVVAWFLAAGSTKATWSGRVVGLEARLEELRLQLQRAEAALAAAVEQIRQLEAARTAAESRAAEAARNLEEQRRLLGEASAKLGDTFRSLAAEALRENRVDFLTLAEQQLKGLTQSATADLDARKTSIQSLIEPLQETLAGYKREMADLEERRMRQVGAIEQQYREVASAAASLQQETSRLVNALRSPHVRGRWGQVTLRRTAELAGMVPFCDFYEQETVVTEGGRLRPDMLVRLPSARLVVVDSKVPLDGYLDALDATTDLERDAALARHARQTRDHVLRLASKEYESQFDSTPEFVVLFIPNDSFLAAAAERDPGLVETALARGVVVATPATLIALLRAVAHGWRQEQLAQSAKHIATLGQQLADRLATLAEHVERVGASLARAVESYNLAVASLESRVLPAARRFRLLGANPKKAVPELQPIATTPRSLVAPLVPEGAQQIFPEEAEIDSSLSESTEPPSTSEVVAEPPAAQA